MFHQAPMEEEVRASRRSKQLNSACEAENSIMKATAASHKQESVRPVAIGENAGDRGHRGGCWGVRAQYKVDPGDQNAVGG